MSQNALFVVPSITEQPVPLPLEAETKKKEALKLALAVTQVTNADELQASVNSDLMLKNLQKEAEDCTDLLQGPFYRTYKKIMARGKEYCFQIITERARQKKLRDDYAAAEDRRVQAENERLENERIAAEKKAQDAIDAQTRISNLAKPQPKKEIAAEVKVQEALMNLRQVQTTAPAVVTRAAGYTVKKVLKFEITNPTALYAVRPEWFNLVEKKSTINAAITKDTQLPGLKVWEAINTGTRG